MTFHRTGARLVFISHAGEDTWIARQIAAHAAECGAQPFLDRADNVVGTDFEEQLLAVLEHADEMVVLFTPWSLERPYIWAELGTAWFRRIPIVVVLLGLSATDLQSRPNLPVFTKKPDVISLNDIDKYFAQLRTRTVSGASHG